MQKGQPCWGQDARNRSLDPEALRVGQALRGRAWGEESRGGEEEMQGARRIMQVAGYLGQSFMGRFWGSAEKPSTPGLHSFAPTSGLGEVFP